MTADPTSDTIESLRGVADWYSQYAATIPDPGATSITVTMPDATGQLITYYRSRPATVASPAMARPGVARTRQGPPRCP